MKIWTTTGNLKINKFPCKNKDLMKNLKEIEQYARSNGYCDTGKMFYSKWYDDWTYVPF